MTIDFTNLNWNTATVLDGRYIYYLAMMVHERSTQLGFVFSNFKFNINEYSPTGIFRYNQLHQIYIATLELGQSFYFNSNNLTQNSFKNHKLRRFLNYTLSQLSDIADFDFFDNPLIPNQRLDFYNKFLKPLYLLLKEYKKICFNKFYEFSTISGYYASDTTFPNATDLSGNIITNEINHIEQKLDGPNLISHYSFQNLKDREERDNFHGNIYGVVGGLVAAKYEKNFWYGYKTTHWEEEPTPPIPPETGWSFNSANASFSDDSRYQPPMLTDTQYVRNISWNGVNALGGTVYWSLNNAHAEGYVGAVDENDNVIWERESYYDVDKEDMSESEWNNWMGGTPQATIAANGQVTITFHRKTVTSSYVGDPVDGTTFTVVNADSKQYEDQTSESWSASVTLIYHDPEPGPGPTPSQSGWVIDGNEFDYAQEYEGFIWQDLRIKNQMQIVAPLPLKLNGQYTIYLIAAPEYSEQYNLDDGGKYAFITVPSGDYFISSSGTISNSMQTFDIELNEKYFCDGNIFENYPVSTLWQEAKSVDYYPYSYDENYWTIIGDTPATNHEHDLTPGKELKHYVDCPGQKQVTIVACWYRPILVIDYSSTFQYN